MLDDASRWRDRTVLARRPVHNRRLLARVPCQEKFPSTTGAGWDLSRTTPMLQAETSLVAQIRLRVRNNRGRSPHFAPESVLIYDRWRGGFGPAGDSRLQVRDSGRGQVAALST
jgi:hypothetical protein